MFWGITKQQLDRTAKLSGDTTALFRGSGLQKDSFSLGKTEKESGHFCSCHAGWNCRGLFLIALAGQCPEVSPAKHQSIRLPQLTGEATKLHFILSCSIYLGLFFCPFALPYCFLSSWNNNSNIRLDHNKENNSQTRWQMFVFRKTWLLLSCSYYIIKYYYYFSYAGANVAVDLCKVGEVGQHRGGFYGFLNDI